MLPAHVDFQSDPTGSLNHEKHHRVVHFETRRPYFWTLINRLLTFQRRALSMGECSREPYRQYAQQSGLGPAVQSRGLEHGTTAALTTFKATISLRLSLPLAAELLGVVLPAPSPSSANYSLSAHDTVV